MPDPQPEKRRPLDLPAGERSASQETNAVPYAELHCRTNFSFLEGASHPDELVHRAQQLGLTALAITDRNSVAGVVRAHAAAKDVGLKLLIGAEVTPINAPPVVLLATDRAAYGRLCQLITAGRRRAPKGECELTFNDVAEHAQGLLACVPLVGIWRTFPAGRDRRALLQRYKDAFDDRCYALAELHRGPDDRRVLRRMMDAATKASVPLIAANDVHYHVPQRQFLHETLTAIRHGCTISQLGDRLFPNSERHLKSSAEMLTLFADDPAAVAHTAQVADRCRFSLDELRYQYPKELCPPEFTPIEYLKRLTADGANHRYPHGIPEKVRQLIDHELRLIEELRYEAYFLTVWDLVRFARSRDILCQGRGSAANSAVCYCLGVTSVDPERIDVLFERFISKERDEAPDIDVDFEHERREEVIQYLYEKYGRERAGMAATVITYRPRSAVRDVGKALGLSLDRVDTISKSLERTNGEEELAGRLQNAGLNPTSSVGRQLIGLVGQILDFPRHLSQHVGGMVLTAGPLCEMVPIENASMPGRTVIQWDKNDLETLGILKVDCLSLGMLTAIRKCFSLIKQHDGRKLTLATVPAEDPAVYEMVSRADTIGVFQIESRAQMSMLPRLRPQCFYDLVIEVAIVRPGPIQGDMVHPYLRRRSGEEPVEFPDERIQAVLQKTLGVPIFQEQAMRLAVVAAGFTPGEADQLRRAMGAWRRRGVIDAFRQKLIEGMDARGYSTEFAERLFNQIRGFGEYGFPESHAASFALLVYVSAWMKRHYPAAFTTALLNSQPMGFYAAAQLISDVRQHGVEVHPVDVNHSDWDCTLEPDATKARGPRSAGTLGDNPALRLGFRMVRGLSFAHGGVIIRQRNGVPFTSFDDFTHRTQLPNAALKKLSKADAFGTLGLNRRAALWHSLPEQKSLPLFDGATTEEPAVNLPSLSQKEQVVADYQTAGLSLRGHPIQFIRPLLDELQVVPSSELSHLPVDRRYRVAGLVLLRQRPSTAKGITFVTLEDETGTANLIIRQDVWERYRPIASHAGALIAHGHLQRLDEVIHLLVDRMEDLSRRLEGVELRSRDFR
ncbi:MAG: error-prone DNA polymerase [Planctomycetaceae bacterium]|jgi:error-prone DNA polymerase|nr:error-prone DNA polymerase [Planctomycetaceae bacterium]MBT6483718.1 error-prone DNA polymerase [Planctomycetaceae bacterium]MBT6497196.1 error-prone DNA polymerase [Planctomycetaceae bacterium]